MALFFGLDIGSGTSKGVVIKDGVPVAYHILPSGVDYKAVAQQLRDEILTMVGSSVTAADITDTVATGHGATSVDFCRHRESDIICCARGIFNLFPSARTVIDIQRTYTQVIRLNAQGMVENFLIDEKCATGSGCFLDIVSHVLRIDLKDVGPLSLEARNPVAFTTGCAVFGESEAISRVSEGTPVNDILAGVHQALANKISSLVDRLGLIMDCAITGGGALNAGLIKAIEDKMGFKLLLPEKPQFVNALGAAILAASGERNGNS